MFNVLSYTLHPNPAKDHFTIQQDLASQIEKVNIYNMLGQAVLTIKETNINTSKLASGSNIFQINTNKGKLSKKLNLE
ncbi:T9SS type A sorting domain-containing protein [Aurantibacter sp.]|uniref:T9SS type A sorting domain-containing protein n=1 Tax=Aurantibacter sp. TaxID=2807103 RepID=UPI0035C7AAEB